MPASNTSQRLLRPVYCAKDAEISFELSVHFPAKATLLATVTSPSGEAIAWQRIGRKPAPLLGTTTADSWPRSLSGDLAFQKPE